MSGDQWTQKKEELKPKKTFWTLRLGEKSDAEVIEQIRKSAAWAKRWWWLQFLPLSLIAVMGWEVRKFANGPGPVGQAMFTWNEVIFWASLAGIFGFGAGLKIGHIVMSTAYTFWGDRRTELLLKYYDLAQQEQDNQPDLD